MHGHAATDHHGVDGQARKIVREAGAGIEMEPDNAKSLANAVEALADNPGLVTSLGESARAYVTRQFNRDTLAQRYLSLLHQVAGIEEEEEMVESQESRVESQKEARSGEPEDRRVGRAQRVPPARERSREPENGLDSRV